MSAHPALQTMLRGQQAAVAGRAPPIGTTVEYESDPKRLGRTAIRITAASKDEAQAEIARCMNSAENMGNSFAQFTAPQQKIDRSWQSLGEVIVSQTSQQVAG